VVLQALVEEGDEADMSVVVEWIGIEPFLQLLEVGYVGSYMSGVWERPPSCEFRPYMSCGSRRAAEFCRAFCCWCCIDARSGEA
jgi:hypothetical protein